MSTRRAMIYSCDAPACPVEKIGYYDGPIGFSGTVTEVNSGGGVGKIPWFACTREHIGPAIAAVIEDAWSG